MLNDSVIQCMLMRGCLVSGSEYELTHKAGTPHSVMCMLLSSVCICSRVSYHCSLQLSFSLAVAVRVVRVAPGMN